MAWVVLAVMRETDACAIVASAYEAAFDPMKIPKLLERMADAVGAQSAWLASLNILTGGGRGIISRIDPDMPALYQREFAAHNLFARAKSAADYDRLWPRAVMTDEEVTPKDAFIRSAYYKGFLVPQDIHSIMTVKLAMRGNTAVSIKINRREADGPFSQEDRDHMERLSSHLARSFEMSEQMVDRSELLRGLFKATDVMREAVLLVGVGGRLRYANAVAEAALSRGAPLTCKSGVISAGDAAIDAELDRALKAACAPEAGPRRGSSIQARNGSHPSACTLSITPLPEDQVAPAVELTPSALVWFRPAAELAPVDAQLGHLFQLTPAEVRVVGELAKGASAREAAASLGSSFHTVRTQAASAYAKLGVHRRAELAAVLSQLRS